MSRLFGFAAAAAAAIGFAGIAYRTYRRNRTKADRAASALAVWCAADAVCFDVDSTVTTDEAIDELAAHFGVGAAVAEYTNQAMNGSVSFDVALKRRLELIQPTASGVKELLRVKPPRLTPGIKQLVSLLHARGTAVYLVSGGFRELIAPVAAELNIPKSNITANRILFDPATGKYAGYDDTELTCRNGGKAKAVAHIIAHGTAARGTATGGADTKTDAKSNSAAASAAVYHTVVMVGDGITDVEACPPATIMIGYGGVKCRPAVQAAATHFVTDFQELIQPLLENPRTAKKQ